MSCCKWHLKQSRYIYLMLFTVSPYCKLKKKKLRIICYLHIEASDIIY